MKKQKAFLKTLLKSINQAKETQSLILQALAIGVSNKEVCVEYAQALQSYIVNAERMVLQCTIAYGEGSSTIAVKAKINQQSAN
jgi:hypothetical protein